VNGGDDSASDLVLTKDVLYLLSYISNLYVTAWRRQNVILSRSAACVNH
jgi:hypothetical protein